MLQKILPILLLCFVCAIQAKTSLSSSISKIKPSVVAIGVHDPLGSPRVRLTGTGFVVADGTKIVTNYHVIARVLNEARNERYVVLSGTGSEVQMHSIQQTKTAPAHDLAVLSIATALPAVTLANEKLVAEGTEIAFTGFPITNVLGLYPATHRGIISAITPIAAPADNSSQLQAAALKRLKQPYMVYQLDATAYPGNSGSPLYDAGTAQVIGIINKVFVKSTREAVLSDPSAISYAIPVQFLLPLLAD
ncbi:MAG: serine protease [Gammaproteobacteria bacterium]|nr:serine protease [Gammaproteobacteria bacterium]MBU1557115.1 serine protease [Gammaproteobacteria bacterium]MBU2071266.1 serine protease [Gammaproteobacteria bacterium]MBU2181673.1 serine protease [Gammaproteobacteria bacterium]MBU2205339.1 serine protease [Gammaproteobacteria bacterium]